MNEQLATAQTTAAIAALGLVSLVLGILARYAPEIVKTLLERAKLINLERAGSIAAQATEERARGEQWSSAAKQENAQLLVRSIAPNATKAAGTVEIADVVRAGVARMRASVPTPEQIEAAVRIVSSSPPANIPPPPKVPEGMS